jgi:hypothetical protein
MDQPSGPDASLTVVIAGPTLKEEGTVKSPRSLTANAGRHNLWMRLRCHLGEPHLPVRQPLGGFRCARCGKPAADLEDLGFHGEGYLSEKTRRLVAAGGSQRVA